MITENAVNRATFFVFEYEFDNWIPDVSTPAEYIWGGVDTGRKVNIKV